MRRIVDWLIGRAQRTPYFHLYGYMNRWWLFKTKYVSARIHQTLRSDSDRHLHDHPWWNISIVLRGGYWEVMPRDPFDGGRRIVEVGGRYYAFSEFCVVVWRCPGSIVFRRSKTRHKLILPDGQDCWSLFIMGPRSQTWGFYTEQGKISWREYERTPNA